MNPLRKMIDHAISAVSPRMEVTDARKKLKKYSVVTRQTKKSRVFLATSVPFVKKYKKELSVASDLIKKNMSLLMQGIPVEEKGFVIKREYNGRMYAGINASMTLSVSVKGKIFFVKMGGHCGENVFEGYARAREYFKSKGNKMHGFRVDVVPTFIFYRKKGPHANSSEGMLVSQFLSKERFQLLRDVEILEGWRKFTSSDLGRAVDRIRLDLLREAKVKDAETINCFIDKKTKTLYFFDLFAPGRY